MGFMLVTLMFVGQLGERQLAITGKFQFFLSQPKQKTKSDAAKHACFHS